MAEIASSECLLTADNIAVPHGFTTRLGGVSKDFLASLNIGYHRGDDPENIRQNYARLGAVLGFPRKTWSLPGRPIQTLCAL